MENWGSKEIVCGLSRLTESSHTIEQQVMAVIAPINETPAIQLRFDISKWGRREQNGAVEVVVGRRQQGEQNGGSGGEQNGADGKDSDGCVGALGIDKVGNDGIESRRPSVWGTERERL
ncbi:hypothetical protein ACFE04_009334 [Oxalis oulophora]